MFQKPDTRTAMYGGNIQSDLGHPAIIKIQHGTFYFLLVQIGIVCAGNLFLRFISRVYFQIVVSIQFIFPQNIVNCGTSMTTKILIVVSNKISGGTSAVIAFLACHGPVF
jgi:isoprenylcysteine carboxyl methyltransferase (ICMT) family protein YpbQ